MGMRGDTLIMVLSVPLIVHVFWMRSGTVVNGEPYKTKLAPHEQEVRASLAHHANATLIERCEMLADYVAARWKKA
jgi:hypothetical protein